MRTRVPICTKEENIKAKNYTRLIILCSIWSAVKKKRNGGWTIVEEYASSIVEEIVPYASYSQTYDDQRDLDGISRHKMIAYYDLVKLNLYQTYFDLTWVNYNRSSLHGGTASYSNMKTTIFTSGAGYERRETALTTTHSIPDTNNYNVYPTAHDAMLQGAAQMTCTLSFTVQVGVNLYNRSARLNVLPGW